MEFVGIGLGVAALVVAVVISRRTDKLIEKEDARAKELIAKLGEMIGKIAEMIEAGNKRHEEMIQASEKRHQETMRASNKRHEELIAKMDQTQARIAELIAEVARRG
jgi:hypothetical protein